MALFPYSRRAVLWATLSLFFSEKPQTVLILIHYVCLLWQDKHSEVLFL